LDFEFFGFLSLDSTYFRDTMAHLKTYNIFPDKWQKSWTASELNNVSTFSLFLFEEKPQRRGLRGKIPKIRAVSLARGIFWRKIPPPQNENREAEARGSDRAGQPRGPEVARQNRVAEEPGLNMWVKGTQ